MLSSSTSTPFKARHLVCLDLLRPDGLPGGGGSESSFARRVHSCRRLLTYGRTVGWKITYVFEHTVRARRSWALEGLEPLQIEPVLYRTGVSAFSNRMFRERVEAASEAELILISLSLSPTCLATALAADRQDPPTPRAGGLPRDAEGIHPDALTGACERLKPRALYLNPTLQNPTTLTVPVGRRTDIAEAARRLGYRRGGAAPAPADRGG